MLASWAPGLWVLGLWATLSHGTNLGELTWAYLWLPEVLGPLPICDHVALSHVAFMAKYRGGAQVSSGGVYILEPA